MSSAGRSRRSLGNAGVAALEFALVAPVLLTILGGVTDFAFADADQNQVNAAADAAAAYAFAAQQAAGMGNPITPETVLMAAQAAISLSGVAVTVTRPTYDCVQTTGGSTRLVSSSQGATCPDGTSAGLYMTITVQYPYVPMLPVFSTLSSQTLSAADTVRLY